jgi:hypothetical protein
MVRKVAAPLGRRELSLLQFPRECKSVMFYLIMAYLSLVCCILDLTGHG